MSSVDPNLADSNSEQELFRFAAGNREPQWRHDPVRPRWVSVRCRRRRRPDPRPARQRTESGNRAGESAANRRPSAGRRAGICHSTRQSICRPHWRRGLKSGRRVYATSGGWPSTTTPGGCGPPMSATIPGKKSTSSMRRQLWLESAGRFSPFCPAARRPHGRALDLPAGAVEPVFAYHHAVGNCVVGGMVYRGQRVSELRGAIRSPTTSPARSTAPRYNESRQRATSVARVGPPACRSIRSARTRRARFIS